MLSFKLSDLSQQFDCTLQGDDMAFEHVSIDSRTILAGEAFIAIVGPQFDGHDFVKQAKDRGASCAIVTHPVDYAIPQLIVKDTRLMLGELAALRRKQLNIPVIAVTGSCGKTTTKSILAAILGQVGQVNYSQASYNNDFGLPLTLLQTNAEHDFCVLEMGANHPGEIAYLTHIAKPTVAIVTMAAPVHLEGFGDLPGVAAAKGEIFQGLNEDGTGIINVDDRFFSYWKDLLDQHNSCSFAIDAQADVRATGIKTDSTHQTHFVLHYGEDAKKICLPLIGEHHVYNVLAAVAACLNIGISFSTVVKGIESIEPVDKRMVKLSGLNNAQILDDSYNANPTAVLAAIKVLANSFGEKILVLGDMGELGDQAQCLHQEVGRNAKEQGIDAFFTYGELAKASATAFGTGAEHFCDQQLLVDKLRPLLTPTTTVLVKGSRSMKMENIVSALKMESIE